MPKETVEKKSKVHGKATVGVDVGPSLDWQRTAARLGRLRESLKRATGERATSLQDEINRLQTELSTQLAGIQAAVDQAINPPAEEPEED